MMPSWQGDTGRFRVLDYPTPDGAPQIEWTPDEEPPPSDEPPDVYQPRLTLVPDLPESGGTDMLPDITAVPALLAVLDPGPRRAEARRIAGLALDAGLSVAEQQGWKDVLKGAGLSGRDFDQLAAAAKKAARSRRRLATAAPGTGALLPSPADPERVARALAATLPSTGDVCHRAWWRDDWFDWTGAHWAPIELSVVEKWVYHGTRDATYVDVGPSGIPEVKPWQPNRSKVGDVLHAFSRSVVQHEGEADQAIACANGVLDLTTGKLMPHTPARFNLSSLPYDYDPAAQCPTWEKFLSEVLPGQDDDIAFVQEWFGYAISGKTDQQKIANFYGVGRGGKSTVVDTLAALVGGDPNMVTVTFASLAGPFGLQSLIGKRLYLVKDADWTHRDLSVAVERIKGITGGGSETVDRKNKEAWTGRLPGIFTFAGNPQPTAKDASGAMTNRMINVYFGVSFLGREDLTLGARIAEELSGILNWALEGLRRLNARGRFNPSAASRQITEEMAREASGVGGFIADRCTLGGTGDPVEVATLHAAYRAWCDEQGHERTLTQARFSRELREAGAGRVKDGPRKRVGAGPGPRTLIGIGEQYPGAFDAPKWLIGPSSGGHDRPTSADRPDRDVGRWPQEHLQ